MSMNQTDAAHVAAHLARMAEPGLGNELRESLLRVVAHLNAQITRMNQPLFNPPAFPPQVVRDGDGLLVEAGAYGMQTGASLRDYFAARIMATFLHGAVLPPGFDASEQIAFTAMRSYECADAMLKERDK